MINDYGITIHNKSEVNMKPVILKDFIKKVDFNKFPNITVMDEFESMDADDIVKGGVLREKIFKSVEDLKVLPKENPNSLTFGVCGTYVIHCVMDDE